MRLHLVAVGWKMPGWVEDGYQEYARRMPREMPLHLVEIRPEKRGSQQSREQVLDVQRRQILEAIPAQCAVVVLDERGQSMTTLKLSQHLAGWRQSGRDVAFVIGGAEGLHEAVKARGDLLWSLSALTLPHGMVRVMLAEQLYRAHTVLSNHPYHREG